MKKNKLREDIKKEIVEAIERKKIDNFNNDNIQELIKKISEIRLLCIKPMAKIDKKVIYIYQNLDIVNLYDFVKIYLELQEIGYFQSSKKVLLNETYRLEYNDMKFVLFLSYEFKSFEVKSKDCIIEPYAFVADKLSVDLVYNDKIVWSNKYNLDISEDIYIKQILNLDIEIMPCLKTRSCEISIFEKGNEISTNKVDNLNEVFKYILDIIVDKKIINKNEILKTTFRNKGIFSENAEVDSNFVFNDVVIGRIRKKDTLYRYEATFKIYGVDRYIKLIIYLTKDEYNKKSKIQKYISPEKQLSKVNMKSSRYLGNEFNIFRINYYGGENNANMYINSKENNFEEEMCVDDIMSSLFYVEPNLIDISDKRLPFPRVILYKNILREIKKDVDMKHVKVFDVDYEDIIYIENDLYFLKKYIVIINGIVYKVELLSQLMQGILACHNCNIDLPVILSEVVELSYQEIKSVPSNIDDYIYLHHFYNSKKSNDLYKINLIGKRDSVMLDIVYNYKKYFDNVIIYTMGNLNNLKNSIDETLEYKKDISIFDIINSKNDEFIIGLKDKNTLRAFYDEDYYDEKIDLFIGKYLIGTKFIEKSSALELSIKQDDEKFKKCLLEVNVTTKDIPFSVSLFYIFNSYSNNELITEVLSNEDELTKIYIEIILGIYDK